jgi:hypothetical protein
MVEHRISYILHGFAIFLPLAVVVADEPPPASFASDDSSLFVVVDDVVAAPTFLDEKVPISIVLEHLECTSFDFKSILIFKQCVLDVGL